MLGSWHEEISIRDIMTVEIETAGGGALLLAMGEETTTSLSPLNGV